MSCCRGPTGQRNPEPTWSEEDAYDVIDALGYFHIDIAEVRTTEGKLHLFVAIDRTTKFALDKRTPKIHRRPPKQMPN